MTGTEPINEIVLPGLKLFRRGKVRDVYEIDDEHLLVVATDRVSAFDCILPTRIARKGEVLTALSRFWFERLAQVTPHHLVTTEVERMPDVVRAYADVLRGRSMLVRRTQVFPVECVVRGYLAGSGWKDYQHTGEVCGQRLPEGMLESDKLP
ncbi:MAG: phosphoribosylaminoimidazolesuccinocarboxamide synthase, partial [Acidobacteria bacterium]|nr:phosphoribosylaminoimidazolesuccinocarboxamide synthase [Acidobacteriota bacterium]